MMNNFPNKLLIIVCALILNSCSSPDDTIVSMQLETVINDKPIEKNILQLINVYRLEKGFSKLNQLNIIKTQTHEHTNYMIAENVISHDYFYKRKEFLKNNAEAISVGENVAYGYSSAQSVVSAWLKSDEHKKNIEGDFNYFDVSAEINSKGRWYFTNIFIKK